MNALWIPVTKSWKLNERMCAQEVSTALFGLCPGQACQIERQLKGSSLNGGMVTCRA